MKALALDKGESSGIANTPVPYVAIAYLYFESTADFQDVMKRNGADIMADIPKYTNITPLVQISKVVQQLVIKNNKIWVFNLEKNSIKNIIKWNEEK